MVILEIFQNDMPVAKHLESTFEESILTGSLPEGELPASEVALYLGAQAVLQPKGETIHLSLLHSANRIAQIALERGNPSLTVRRVYAGVHRAG